MEEAAVDGDEEEFTWQICGGRTSQAEVGKKCRACTGVWSMGV